MKHIIFIVSRDRDLPRVAPMRFRNIRKSVYVVTCREYCYERRHLLCLQIPTKPSHRKLTPHVYTLYRHSAHKNRVPFECSSYGAKFDHFISFVSESRRNIDICLYNLHCKKGSYHKTTPTQHFNANSGIAHKSP